MRNSLDQLAGRLARSFDTLPRDVALEPAILRLHRDSCRLLEHLRHTAQFDETIDAESAAVWLRFLEVQARFKNSPKVNSLCKQIARLLDKANTARQAVPHIMPGALAR